MKFICYSDWDQLPAKANTLFEQSEKKNIFLSRPWFECVSGVALEDDESLLLACVLSDDEMLAILPLVMNSSNNCYALKHRYTPTYSLLFADHDQQQVLACLALGLSQMPVKALLLEPVADDDSGLKGLQLAMESAGFSCDYTFRHYNWIYRVQDASFESYMAARPANLRNTLSRKKRKLEREHDVELRLFAGEEVPQYMPDYYAAYTASWKANEQYVDFLDDIVMGFSKAGWSRLGVIYIDGQPAASQLWFVHHGKASIFRLAYNEAWRQYSPGSILTSYLMEYVIDVDKVEEIDFLVGNEAYKQDWMSECRVRFAWSCIRKVKPAGGYASFMKSLRGMWKILYGTVE